MFPTLREKREYVREELIRRGEWNLPELWQEFAQEEGAPEILLRILSMEGMGPSQSPPNPQSGEAPDPAPPVLVRSASQIRGRRETEMWESRRNAEEAKKRMEEALAADAEGANSGAGAIPAELVQCAWEKCMIQIPASARGKRFCSDACRAEASREAQFKRRLAHRVPEQTAERRALRLAGLWLAGRA